MGLWFVFSLLVPGCGFYLLSCWWWLCPYVVLEYQLISVSGRCPFSLVFRGDAVRFSFFLVAFLGFMCIVFWWALAFW